MSNRLPRLPRPLLIPLILLGLTLLTLCLLTTAVLVSSLPFLYQSHPPAPPIVWNALPTPRPINPDWRSFSSTGSVRDTAVRNDLLWLATDGGLVVQEQSTGAAVHFKVEHGLPGNRLTAVDIGRDGRVWVGTANSGVGRYDGTTWTTFGRAAGLPSDEINDLLVDGAGVVWAATAEGLARFDGQGWQTVRLSLFDFSRPAVRQLAQSRRGLYAATAEGLWFFDGREWLAYTRREGLPADDVLAVAITPDEQVWVGTALGLARLDVRANRWQRFGTAEGLTVGQAIPQLLARPDDSVWLVTAAGELWQFDGLRPTAVSAPPRRQIQTLGQLGNALLIGTADGAARQTAAGWAWLELPQDLPSNALTGLVATEAGVFVAGRGGLYEYLPAEDAWRLLPAFGDWEEQTLAALTAVPGGGLVVAFDAPTLGVAVQQPDQSWATVRCHREGAEWGRLYAGARGADGRRWLVGDTAVFVYDGQTWQSYAAGLPPEPEPRDLAIAPNGDVWLALQQGLYRLDEAAGTWRQVSSLEMWRVAAAPEGQVWVAAATGLFVVQEAGLVSVGTPAITAVRDLVATAEGVWIAHEGGVAQFASDGTGWRLHTVADGLPSNDVTALTQAPDGTLWAGFVVARLGFAQFDAAQNEWRLRRYDPQQEAAGSSTFHPGSLNPRPDPVTALVVRQDGSVWFGTRNGRVGGVAADSQLLDDQLDPLIRWNDVNALFEDAEQGLWIGSFNGRVVRYQAGEWAVFEPELARAQVRSVVGTPQGYWLGTDLGIVFLAEGACGFVSAPDRRVLAVSTAVGTAAGEVWWGTSNEGALRQDTRTASLNWVSPLRARDVSAVALAPDSSVWFGYGAAGQLLRYEPATGRGETLVVEMETGEMTALAFDGRGTRPWVGTRQGLLRPDGAGWQRLTTADGLADNEVVQMVVAGDGSLWVLTPGGVSWSRGGSALTTFAD